MTAWTTDKPCVPGAYYVRGFDAGAPRHAALVEVRNNNGTFVCNLHETNSDVFDAGPDEWPWLQDLRDTFEWLGPLFDPDGAIPGIEGPLAKAAFLSNEAQSWYLEGEHGMSSCAMFTRVTGVPHPYLDEQLRDPWAHPWDVGDFRLCRLLVEAVPEVRAGFRAIMPRVSPTWRALITNWNELCRLIDAESSDWRNSHGNCHAAYALMKEIIRDAEAPSSAEAGS